MLAHHPFGRLLVAVGCVLAFAGSAAAQSSSEGWQFSIYPILAWVPTNIGIEVNVPTDGGGGGSIEGEIVDSRFDGAFLGGFSATNGTWRVDTDFLWLGVGGDRPSSPNLTVDADVIYGHGAVGFKIYKDLFVTGGIRRFALKYDIQIADRSPFSRKPGLWDPLVGVAYHHVGEKFEAHGLLDVGGFGVGSESEFGAAFRVDWKPVRHFGFTGGYNYLRFNFEDDVAGRTFKAKQTLAGPVVGIGLYF
jgi:hypothetical protein